MKSIAYIAIVALLVNTTEASHFKQMMSQNLQQYLVKNSTANVTAMATTDCSKTSQCCPEEKPSCGCPCSGSAAASSSETAAAPAVKEAKKASKKVEKKLEKMEEKKEAAEKVDKKVEKKLEKMEEK